MPPIPRGDHWYWETFDPGTARAGAELAALRKGIGREPGAAAELWRFYRARVPDSVAVHGRVTSSLAAEHAALTLFALHQQSQLQPMHHAGRPLGTALRRMRNDTGNAFSPEAVDRRVTAAATATSVTELVAHLRSLITQLRSVREPLDYTRLLNDIYDWHFPDRRSRVRRRWGSQYFAWSSPTDQAAAEHVDAASTATVAIGADTHQP